MSKSPEDLKKMITERARQRVEARQAAAADVPEETLEVEAEEVFEGVDEITGDEGVDEFQHYLATAHEEGYDAYMEGKDAEDNPFGALLGEEEDPSKIDTVHIIAEAWQEGWIGAHTESCITSLILTAKGLVEADTEEKATAQFANLEAALETLSEVMDLNELQESWNLVE